MSRPHLSATTLTLVVLSALGTIAFSAPIITPQPQPTILAESGQSATLQVIATGEGRLSYQWRHHGVAVPGATGSALSIPLARMADEGFYDVVVTDDVGTATSHASCLRVSPAGGYPNSLCLDTSFTPRLESPGAVTVIASLADGRYYVGGDFMRIGGAARTAIARFLADGSVDPSFVVPSGGIAGTVNAIAVQLDGKVVVGGDFPMVCGAPRNGISRLNDDGSLDTTFDPGYGCDGTVTGVVVDSVGCILVCGEFRFVNGWPRRGLVRLTSSGAVDYSFFPGPPLLDGYAGIGFDGSVHCIALDADGKIVLGGAFNAYNNVARKHLARLNGDGTLDTGFDPGMDVGFPVRSVALPAGGGVLAGGDFANGATTSLVRLDASGSRATAFGGGAAFDGSVERLLLQSDGKIVVGGDFGHYGVEIRNRIARLGAEGILDSSFDPGSGFDLGVAALARLASGGFLVGGGFLDFDDHAVAGLAQLSERGEFVGAASGECRTAASVRLVSPTSGGRWLVAGSFSWADDFAFAGQALVQSDGTVDPAYVPDGQLGGAASCRAVQIDGKLLEGGVGPGAAIRRYNLDGSLDTTFSVGSGFDQSVMSIAVQLDGKLVVGGAFTSCNGTAYPRIVRLNGDGSIDSTFDPGLGFDSSVSCLAIQPNGKIVAGGWFVHYGDQVRQFIARLNPDGSLDSSFAPGGFDGPVNDLLLQNDGRIVVSGWFSSFGYANCGKVVRLYADGSLDIGFQVADIQRVYSSSLPTVDFADDGRLLVSGVHAGRAAVAQSKVAMFTSLEPVVTMHPRDAAVAVDSTATFSVGSRGAGPITYHWMASSDGGTTWMSLSDSFTYGGVTTGILSVEVDPALSGYRFRCVVSNGAGSGVASDAAILMVVYPELPAGFDADSYLRSNPDVAAAIGATSDRLDRAWKHFYLYGVYEGRSPDGEFTAEGYLVAWPDLQAVFGTDVRAAAMHWFNQGRYEGRGVPAGFDAIGYLARNPDVQLAFGLDLYGAWKHYFDFGVEEGRVFDDGFRVDEYLAMYTDVPSGRREALLHWLNTGRNESRQGRVPPTFDVNGYLARYADLQAAFGSNRGKAWGHYLDYGAGEGRTDGDFDAIDYLAKNGDVYAAFGNDVEAAALHWYLYGRYEGRRISGGFDAAGYLARYGDLQAAFTYGEGHRADLYGAWLHFYNWGLEEGRVYDDSFRVDEYLARYGDLQAAFGTDRRAALLHWLRFGRGEGRVGRY